MDDLDADSEYKPRRGPGRPPGSPNKNKGGRKTVTTTRQESIEPIHVDDDDDDDDESPPIFDKGGFGKELVAKVRVTRIEPDEGVLGIMNDPYSLTEAAIREVYGGGTFRLDALDMGGRIRKSMTRKIAGDPIFMSFAAEFDWRKRKGMPQLTPGGSAPDKNSLSIMDVLTLIKTTEAEKAKESEDRDTRRRQEEREWKAQQERAEREHQEKMRVLDVEADRARRRDEEERERRRKNDEDERDARRKREAAEAEARQQQFMAQTITMLQQSSNQALQFVRASAGQQQPQNNNLMDAVKTVVAIKEAFAGEGNESQGDESPLNLLIKHGGEWVSGLANGIGGAIREVRGGGAQPAQAAAAPATTVKSPLALPPGSPLNSKVETLVAKLAAKGYDPFAAMDQIVDTVLRDVDGLPRNGAPIQASQAPQAPGGPRPFVQGPEGVARTTSAPATTVNSAPSGPKVLRFNAREIA